MFDTLCPVIYKKLRLRAGMTQDQLATVLNTSRMTVMRFEAGRARPNREQEARLKELAGCSDVAFVELLCEQLSREIGQRVGLFEDSDFYRPTTALAEAYALLDHHSADLGPRQVRALQDRISLSQSLETALGKSNAHLTSKIGECRDLLADRRQRTC